MRVEEKNAKEINVKEHNLMKCKTSGNIVKLNNLEK